MGCYIHVNFEMSILTKVEILEKLWNTVNFGVNFSTVYGKLSYDVVVGAESVDQYHT